jgi:hypothetical protein
MPVYATPPRSGSACRMPSAKTCQRKGCNVDRFYKVAKLMKNKKAP